MEQITEALSSTVYHATTLKNAEAILKEKAFKLAGTYGSGIEWSFTHDRKKSYFMSVTRSKLGSFHRRMDEGVIFVLNGDWFNARYKAKPVDYFMSGFNAGEPKFLKKYYKDSAQKSKGKELEDRIFSSEPTIPMSNLLDVIREIHVLIPKHIWLNIASDSSPTEKDLVVRNLIREIKFNGLEKITWYYGDKVTDSTISRKAWLDQSKKSTTPPEEIASIVGKRFPISVVTKKMGLKWAPDWERKQYEVPFGKKIIGGEPREYSRDEKVHRSKLRNTKDPTFSWRELFHIRHTDAENYSEKLSEPTNKLLNTILRDFNFQYSEFFPLFAESNKQSPPRAWLDIWHREFMDRYGYNRGVADEAETKSKEKLGILLRKAGVTINAFGEYLAKIWWPIGYKFVVHKLKPRSIDESHISRSLTVYHGSNKKFDKFSTKAKRVKNDFFGGGIAYTTDDQKVALSYARAMTYRYGGEEYLYQLNLNLKNIFDVDTVFTGKELIEFTKHVQQEDFLRSAGFLKLGDDKYSLIGKLAAGNLVMNGKEVFKGLSKGLVDSSGAETILKKMGYDGLRYNGGDNMGVGRHNVFIPYYEESIKIEKTFRVQRKKAVNEDTGIGHLIFCRAILPQVNDIDEFLSHMNSINIDYDVAHINPELVRATQLDGFDEEKIKSIASKADIPPIIISSDDFILDGHHRWLAAKLAGKKLQVYRIYLPILELIRVAQDYYRIDYSEDITELFAGLKSTLYAHMNYKKLEYSLEHNVLEARWEHSIPNIHMKNDGMKRTKYVVGTSLSRNPNLNFNNYKFMLELDRNKIIQTNKLHVIDADIVAARVNPHKPESAEKRTRNLYRNNWNNTMDNHGVWDGAPTIENDFAEEFVEGDLDPLSRYIRAIWIKPGPPSSAELIDLIGKYAFDKNVTIKEYPSGRDITADWVEKASEIEPVYRVVKGGLRNNTKRKSLVMTSLSTQLAKIRKSINNQ